MATVLVRNVLAVVLLVLIAGCTPYGTYPPIEGATSLNDPQLAPIPELMAEALWYAYEQDKPNAPLFFNLPPNTPASVYDKVTTKLGVECYAMTTPDEPAYHVTEVRVRGTDAQVDVVRRGPDGRPHLMTVYFQQRIDGIKVTRARRWRIHVNEPMPNYVPPPVEPDAEMATAPTDTDVAAVDPSTASE